MATETTPQTTQQALGALAEGALRDLETLIVQHFNLLRSEMRQEVQGAKDAALSLGVGAGTSALAGILGTVGLVHLVQKATGLPLWACYLGVAGLLGTLGGGFLSTGMQKAAEVDLFPRQTAEVLRQDFGASRTSAGV